MVSLNRPSLPPACNRSALWLSFLTSFPQASSSLPSPHISPTDEDLLQGEVLAAAPAPGPAGLQQAGQSLTVHQQCHQVEQGWSHPLNLIRSSRQWGCDPTGVASQSHTDPGDQAGEKLTYSTTQRKVAPRLGLNGVPSIPPPNSGQGVGLSWGCSGPLKPISAL